MRRAAIERARTVRTWRAHNFFVHRGERTGCICDEQPGRFRKVSLGDCGKARCYLCHSGKLLGEPTIKDLVARDRFRDSLLDYLDEEVDT